MAFNIQESFRVDASPDRVWSYLLDANKVVQCLPGAELIEARSEREFVGRVKVKVGPVTSSYKGRAEFVERDPVTRRIRLTGKGQEASGAGSASMTMSCEILALDSGGAEVRVDVEIDVAGKIVQFGRGMIEDVSRQIFRQFASCVQNRLVEAGATERAVAANPQAEPVNAIALLFRALVSWLRRLFGGSQ